MMPHWGVASAVGGKRSTVKISSGDSDHEKDQKQVDVLHVSKASVQHGLFVSYPEI